MPSSLLVEVALIEQVLPHPNADLLELAHIKGWQCVVPKDRYHAGDVVVYIPPDCMLPVELSDRLGVTKYLSNGRVRCAKLRGEPSFGVVADTTILPQEHAVGDNVAEPLGITKYEPPLRVTAGDAETPHPFFVAYTGIENLRNYPDVLQEGELVSISEKLHGTNCRVGNIEGELMAGSMGLRRKSPEDITTSVYWFPLTLPGVRSLLETLKGKQVILFGEAFGSKIQNLDYGMKGKLGFRAFDLMVNGSYLDASEFFDICNKYDVPTVPLLYTGAYSMKVVKSLSSGQTTLDAVHIREGIVIRPLTERTDPRTGRVILKYINDDYLLKREDGKITDAQDV